MRSANVYVDKMPNESSEGLLRRFNRVMQESGVPTEISRRAYFEKPSDTKRHHLQKVQRRMKLQLQEEKGISPRQKKKKRKAKKEAARLGRGDGSKREEDNRGIRD